MSQEQPLKTWERVLVRLFPSAPAGLAMLVEPYRVGIQREESE